MINKIFKQFILNPNDKNEKVEILNNQETVVSLGIHALPGTRFYIIHGTNPLVINRTGNFSIDCEEFPISSIKVNQSELSDSYATIIDAICVGVEG